MTDTNHPFAPLPAMAAGPAIRCGIGGWVFPAWRDNFYPAGLVQRRELEYASRQLRAIEINGTYYRAQSPATYAKWAAQTPDGFMFSLKAPKAIVQRASLADATKAAAAFVDNLQGFGDRLGPIVWQFTPSRAFDPDDLAPFLDALPHTLQGEPLRHVLEVRHASFLDDRYVSLARAHAVATVFTDSPDYPSLADLTGGFVYARLMRSRSAQATGYPPAELAQWAKYAAQWHAGGDPAALPHVSAVQERQAPKDVFIYFISADKERNPAAAVALQRKVDARR
ncbi:DUF72 domain-containing protein [Dyella sp.]|jgi:uncharacterized protein YecE (DUF72 family)|uniref:DUF72 domain-containing protein n=1 Tax=Dyella sp. TaxID=1869338 RepID=UPI002D7859CB|nr:DUF72 domain-containing protein [Dyella sp.]HET6432508.1 DUF72 domain-containing protein [Dyella sp.]